MSALLLVDVACAFGMVGHVQRSVSTVRRRAKRMLKEFEEVREILNISLNVRIRSFHKIATRFPSRCFSLSHIHRSHCGLHLVVAAFWLTLFASVLTPVY